MNPSPRDGASDPGARRPSGEEPPAPTHPPADEESVPVGESEASEDWGDDWDRDWDDWGPDPGADAGTPGADPRVAAGLEHLQRAAREVIAASRALLDAAEDLVERPDGMSRLAGVVADRGDLAGRTVRAAAADATRGQRHSPDDPDDPEGGAVQRIPVS